MDERKYSKKRKPTNRKLIVTLLILTFSQCSNGIDDEIEQIRREGVEKFDISILVEEKAEFIHSRITLRPLMLGLANFEKLSSEFTNNAKTNIGRVLVRKVKQMHKRIEHKSREFVEHRNDSNNNREKRAIEFIGNLISKAFGNPGPEDMRKINANILALKYAIAKQKDNSVILHNNVDSNQHAIEHQNAILKEISTEIYRSENEITAIDNEMKELQNYIELEIMYDAIMEILEALIDIRQDGKYGRCNQKGLSRNFLINRLRKIESNKIGITPIFSSWEWEKYFHYEMCSVALNRDEIWVTIRIPIVKQAERLVRVIPNSNFVWIKQTMSDLGLDVSLFKEQNHDTFSIVTRSSYEMCTILGTTRVCNLRKTKFKESQLFSVPVEISDNRILIISNSTENEKMKLTAECRGKTKKVEVGKATFLRIPEICFIKSKNVEIESKQKNEFETVDLGMQTVDQVEYKELISQSFKSKFVIVKNVSRSRNESEEFEMNDASTKNLLNQISINHENVSENLRVMKLGGLSSTVIVLMIGMLILICIIRKKCASSDSKKERNEINVNVDVNNLEEGLKKCDPITASSDPIPASSSAIAESQIFNESYDTNKTKINKNLTKK